MVEWNPSILADAFCRFESVRVLEFLKVTLAR